MWGREKRVERYKSQGRVWMIPVREIRQNASPVRREFAYDKLLELAQSISENGLLHPLTVTFEGDWPVLISGQRRLRAAKIAGLREVPCLVIQTDRLQAAALAMVENLQRERLNCFEEAAGIRSLIRQFQLTQEETARLLGCSQQKLADKLRLLELTQREQALLTENGFGEEHARALLQVQEHTRRMALLQRMVTEHWTVAQTEKMTAKKAGEETRGKTAMRPPAPLVKDMRLFFNTLNHAVETMRSSGIAAQIQQTERDGFMELTVRIPKMTAQKPA